MNAAEWLEGKRREICGLEKQIRLKMDEKDRLRSRATRATPSRTATRSCGLPCNNPVESYAENVQPIEEALNALIDRREDLRLEIGKMVDRIPDDDSRRLLYMRYARCMEWNDVAVKLGVLPETARKGRHKRAVEYLQKIATYSGWY